MLKMAVLLSGSGRTLDNFHNEIQKGTLRAQIEVVVADVADALGLEKAKRYGYPAFFAAGDEQINAVLADYELDIICLAGYLQLYSPPKGLEKSVINIHPALIPSFCGAGFYGSRVHRAVKAKGCTVSGCTVHFANEVYDDGPIILQKCVQLDYEDTPDEIATKVFAAECEAYPQALNIVAEKGKEYFWQRVAV